MKLTINQKGQGEETFSILIGIFFAMAILAIMFMVISMFTEQQFEFSKTLLVKSFQDATKAPDVSLKNPVEAKDVLFKKDSALTSAQFADVSGLSDKCIFFDAPDNFEIVELNSERTIAKFKVQQQQNVYNYCTTGSNMSAFCDPNCNMCCTISIKKKPS